MAKHIVNNSVLEFSKDNKPAVKIKSGEKVLFKPMDCFSNQVQSEDILITTIDMTKVNPTEGPVFVENARPGDILLAHILDIRVENRAVITTLPNTGPLIDTAETRTKIIDIEDGVAKFNDIEFPIDPMVGVIGVAPKGNPIACGLWGDHGGNMDNKKIVKGSKVYLPVFVEGGLFQLGDLHAAMGDGEISGAGIEVPGEVLVKLEVIKNKKINRPVIETQDKWYTSANAPSYTEALQTSTKDMQSLIVEAYNWDKTDAYLYMSAQGDIEICQGAFPADWDMTVRFGIPKQDNRPLISKK